MFGEATGIFFLMGGGGGIVFNHLSIFTYRTPTRIEEPRVYYIFIGVIMIDGFNGSGGGRLEISLQVILKRVTR